MFRLRPRKKTKINFDNKQVEALIHKELEPYIKRDELKDYLQKIQSDEEKKKMWDGLSARKKLRLLRYVLAKKGATHEKKK